MDSDKMKYIYFSREGSIYPGSNTIHQHPKTIEICEEYKDMSIKFVSGELHVIEIFNLTIVVPL